MDLVALDLAPSIAAAPGAAGAVDLLADEVGALLEEAGALLAAIADERRAMEWPFPPDVADRVLPLSRKDLAPEDVVLEGVRRQRVRLERESAHLRALGDELLARCRDARARCHDNRRRAQDALDHARRALAVSRAVTDYGLWVAEHLRRRAPAS